MNNEIKCDICKKDINNDDEVLLGSKDDYTLLPDDIKASDIVFLHIDCFKKHLEDKKNE